MSRPKPDEFSILVEAKKASLSRESHWKRIFSGKQDILQKAAEREVRKDLSIRLGIMSFDEFRQKGMIEEQQPNLASTKTGEILVTPFEEMETANRRLQREGLNLRLPARLTSKPWI